MSAYDISKEKQARAELLQADKKLRQQFLWLQHQSAIGLFLLVFSAAMFIATSIAYVYEFIPAIIVIVLNAFWASIMHELEHDNMHGLYFAKNRSMRNFMFAVCWVFRPNMPNPWFRKRIHIHHHKHSGTPEDIEEQIIGNGMPYGFLRLLLSVDIFFCLMRFKKLLNNSTSFKPWQTLSAVFPMHLIYTAIWMTWLQYYGILWFNDVAGFNINHLIDDSKVIAIINILMVCYVLPSLLRYFCLVNISTTIHYSDNVNGALQQAQSLTKWYFLPLQFFCFNFGAEHQIHHIFVRQPFYIRHLLRKKSCQIMKQAGVTMNDLATFKYHNARYEV